MNSLCAIRKYIFRHELDGIFHRFKVTEPDQKRILTTLFDGASYVGDQFLLRLPITGYDQLLIEAKNCCNNADLALSITSIFKIDSDLYLPANLKAAFLRNEPIAFMIGAGVSKPLGYPLWDELGRMAINTLYQLNLINSHEKERLSSDGFDPKQKLTIFESVIKRKSAEGKKFYTDVFGPRSNGDKSSNSYELLVKFNNVIKISFNIDNEFQNALDNRNKTIRSLKQKSLLEDTIKTTPEPVFCDFQIDKVNTDTIYQIHGNLESHDRFILTTADYISAYFDENSRLKTFLKELFNRYTVIFIGYGVSEFPVLEHLFDGKKGHYILSGAYLNEPNITRLKRTYFESLNISLIPYYLDFSGYDRQYLVLESWLKEIEGDRNTSFYEGIAQIDSLL